MATVQVVVVGLLLVTDANGSRTVTCSRANSPYLPAATGHTLKTLTLNFTISNLHYSPDVGNGSATLNSTERVLLYLVRSWSQHFLVG